MIELSNHIKIKSIRVWFCDFWQDFEPRTSPIYKKLEEMYSIKLDSVKPELLFYSTEGYDFLKYNCMRVFYTREQVAPDFDLADYAIGFERMSFNDRYLRYPYYMYYLEKKGKLTDFLSFQEDKLVKKNTSISFVYSNSVSITDRKLFFEFFNDNFIVSSAGNYLNNTGFVTEDKNLFESNHSFSLVIENCNYPGYITEKIIDAYISNSVPIYFGAPDVLLDFNADSLILIRNYDSLGEAKNFIDELMGDSNKYYNILRNKRINESNHLFDKDQLKFFLSKIIENGLRNYKRPISQRSIAKSQKLLFLGKVKRVSKYIPVKLKRMVLLSQSKPKLS